MHVVADKMQLKSSYTMVLNRVLQKKKKKNILPEPAAPPISQLCLGTGYNEGGAERGLFSRIHFTLACISSSEVPKTYANRNPPNTVC